LDRRNAFAGFGKSALRGTKSRLGGGREIPFGWCVGCLVARPLQCHPSSNHGNSKGGSGDESWHWNRCKEGGKSITGDIPKWSVNHFGPLAELELGEKILKVIWARLLISFQSQQLGNAFFRLHKGD